MLALITKKRTKLEKRRDLKNNLSKKCYSFLLKYINIALNSISLNKSLEDAVRNFKQSKKK